MTLQSQRALAAAGLFLQTAVPVGIILTMAGILKTFGEMSGDTAQAAASITGGVATALRATSLGQTIGLIGFGLFTLALFNQKLREPWILKWGRVSMIPWLFMFPIGTTIAVTMLVYFSKHRAEFLEAKRQET